MLVVGLCCTAPRVVCIVAVCTARARFFARCCCYINTSAMWGLWTGRRCLSCLAPQHCVFKWRQTLLRWLLFCGCTAPHGVSDLLNPMPRTPSLPNARCLSRLSLGPHGLRCVVTRGCSSSGVWTRRRPTHQGTPRDDQCSRPQARHIHRPCLPLPQPPGGTHKQRWSQQCDRRLPTQSTGEMMWTSMSGAGAVCGGVCGGGL